MEEIKILTELIRYEVCGSEISSDLKANINQDTLQSVLKLARKHDLAHLVADCVEKEKLLDLSLAIGQALVQEKQLALFRYMQISYEYERVCDLLEREKTPFIQLKGSILREYYPQAWMRTSSDIDVLVKKEDIDRLVKILCEELGYKLSEIGNHDAQLFSESGVHLELHYTFDEENVFKKDLLSFN